MNAVERLLAVARGDSAGDLLLRNGRIVNLFTKEVLAADVVIVADKIAGVGSGYKARETVDLAGMYLAPGLIDAHVHVESALVPPRELARAIVPRGVTTVVTDPHEIANVHGLAGVRFMLADAASAPFTMFVNASSCVPATHMATAGARLGAAELADLAGLPGVIGLAEVMNFPGTVAGDPEITAKLDVFRGRVIDGHSPGLSGARLCAYVAAGPASDHEATGLEEAREKLRLGMRIFLREATNARNLEALLPLVSDATERRLCLCTDDRVPGDLLNQGSIDHMVRLAIAAGVDPLSALRLGSLNTAEYFRLHDRGAIGPGLRADLMAFPDLASPRAELVVQAGSVVAEGGVLIPSLEPVDASDLPTGIFVDLDRVSWRIPATGRRVRVIGIVPDQLVTEHCVMEAAIADGAAVADPARDILKLAVLERHGVNGNVGLGFVKGMGLTRGAMASTVAHDHHNLVVIGADDASMATAARAVVEAGGGLAVADGAALLAEVALPIGGLMSDQRIEIVSGRLERLTAAARELGSPLADPFMAMSFLALEVIPALKLTDMGLVDVEAFSLVPLFAD